MSDVAGRSTRLLIALALVLSSALILVGAATANALEGETFAITEVDFGARSFVITNYGDSEVDPNGLIVCSFPNYAPISGATPLAPGTSLTVDAAALGIPTDAGDGELGLYVSNAFEDPTAIVAYVEWGSTGHQRSPVAQEGEVGGVQVWAGGFVDPQGGSVLTSSAAFPTSPAQWSGQSGEALPRTGTIGLGTAIVGATLLLVGIAILNAGRRRGSSAG